MINGHLNEDIFSLDKTISKVSFIKNLLWRELQKLWRLVCMHWPYKQQKPLETRNYFHTNINLCSGACFGYSPGFERPMWFSRNGKLPKYDYSFNYQNWYPEVEFETKMPDLTLVYLT